MFSKFKQLFSRAGGRSTPVLRIIIIGIDYPSHTLGVALQKQRAEIIAFIDDEPWNHRTKMLGATVHYPREVGALAERYKVDRVVAFKGALIELPEQVQQQLRQLNVDLIEVDSDAMDIEAQVDLVVGILD
jgi:FlaA1/EpsC-like NDP-sugar epimerase